MAEREIPNTNEIGMYLHCGLCVEEVMKLPTESPKSYSRTQVGWTKLGLQIWCNRHEVNVAHIDFESMKHPANTSRPLKSTGGQGSQ